MAQIYQSLIFVVALLASDAQGRDILLNGIDISSARHQKLERVTVRIDGQGNIYIEAPHYQVNEESTFLPLSRWNHPSAAPVHKKPGPYPKAKGKLQASQQQPEATPPVEEPAAASTNPEEPPAQ